MENLVRWQITNLERQIGTLVQGGRNRDRPDYYSRSLMITQMTSPRERDI